MTNTTPQTITDAPWGDWRIIPGGSDLRDGVDTWLVLRTGTSGRMQLHTDALGSAVRHPTVTDAAEAAEHLNQPTPGPEWGIWRVGGPTSKGSPVLRTEADAINLRNPRREWLQDGTGAVIYFATGREAQRVSEDMATEAARRDPARWAIPTPTPTTYGPWQAFLGGSSHRSSVGNYMVRRDDLNDRYRSEHHLNKASGGPVHYRTVASATKKADQLNRVQAEKDAVALRSYTVTGAWINGVPVAFAVIPGLHESLGARGGEFEPWATVVEAPTPEAAQRAAEAQLRA